MAWQQTIETDNVSTFADLKTLVSGLQTAGDIESVKLELEATKPIYNQPPDVLTPDGPEEPTHPEDTQDTQETESASSATQTTKYSTKGQAVGVKATDGGDTSTAATDAPATSSTPSPSTTETPTTADEATEEEKQPVKYRKWPRMRTELGIDVDEPLSAAAYPGETRDFTGNKDADVEHNTGYYARVNGTVEYGAFVTLNGTGYNPKSKYNEISGLLHNDNMLSGHDNWSFTQGDDVVVELISHNEKGLSFRQMHLLGDEEARQARYSELVRLNRLDLSEGDKVKFSDWPTEREYTARVQEINMGQDSPATPPTIELSGAGTEATVRPSEIVATANPVAKNRNGVEDPSPEDVGMNKADSTDEEEPTTNKAAVAPTATGMSASPAKPDLTEEPDSSEEEGELQEGEEIDEDESEIEEEIETTDDTDDTDDGGELECLCGETFERERERRGHLAWCDEYKDWKEQAPDNADIEDALAAEEPPEKPQAKETESGSVLNPILLDTQYAYTKVAIVLYKAGKDIPASRIGEIMDDTDWEMQDAYIQSHLGVLRDKDVVEREKETVYQYWLTDRGEAGVKKMLDEGIGMDIPDFRL